MKRIAPWLVVTVVTTVILYFAFNTAGTNSNSPNTPWTQTTVASAGGLVIVSYRPEEVRLESVAPNPGFASEVEKEGPPDVRVEFESADLKVEIRAEWDGGLVTEIDEDS